MRRRSIGLSVGVSSSQAPGSFGRPAASHAAVVTKAVDADLTNVVGSADVDVASDGSAAITYLKKDAGVEHVYVSRRSGDGWTAGVRVDTGQAKAFRRRGG